MEANGYGRFNHTIQECREGLERDRAQFGEQYALLDIALGLLDSTQEDQELVREWFDLYLMVIDESSYLEFGNRMEELEKRIIATTNGNK